MLERSLDIYKTVTLEPKPSTLPKTLKALPLSPGP